MNIFILDKDPVLAAQFACNQHVLKQTVESAQMLSTAHHIMGSRKEIKKKSFIDQKGNLISLYQPTHLYHPCSLWVRENKSNYLWLCTHALALCHEYTRRYGRIHKSQALIELFPFNFPHHLKEGELTDFAQAMPEKYKNVDAVKAYRDYYKGEKSSFAKWKLEKPEWW